MLHGRPPMMRGAGSMPDPGPAPSLWGTTTLSAHAGDRPVTPSGDRHGADAAGRVPPGAAPDRGADRLRPAAARARPPGAGPLHPEPPRRDAGGAAAAPRARARAPGGGQ